MKHLSRVRPSGVIAFTALFIAMSGIAVADNDGSAKDSGKVNIGKGKIGFGEIAAGAKKKLKGAQGPAGPAGPPGGGGGSGGGGGTASFNFRVDAPADNTVLYAGRGFQLRANCESGTPDDIDVLIEATVDNTAYTQMGSDVGSSSNVNDFHDDNFDVADPDGVLSNQFEEDQVINTLSVRPLTGAVTTITYALDEDEQGFACNVTGNVITQPGT